MSDEPLPPTIVLATLPMIRNDWPAPKRRIVELIGSRPDWWSGDDVGRRLGMSAGRATMHLGALAKDRVIIRQGASGTRPGWCFVSPAIHRWDVPWAIEDRKLREQLLIDAMARDCEAEEERLVARLYGARQTDFVARFYGARQAAAGGRGRGGGAAPKTGLVARHRGARQADDDARDDTSVPGFKEPSTRQSDNQSQEEEQLRNDLTEATDRVAAAIVRRSGGFLAGKPKHRLAQLVEAHGAAALLGELAQVPGNLKPPLVVEHLAMALLDIEPADPEEERRQRVAALRQRATVLMSFLEADPDNEEHRSELAACQDDLRRLEGA